MGDDDDDDDDVVSVCSEFFSGSFAVSLLSFSFSSVRSCCCRAAFCCAVSLATTMTCWRDADGRRFCFRRTTMALSAVPFVSPLTGFGATQVGVVLC